MDKKNATVNKFVESLMKQSKPMRVISANTKKCRELIPEAALYEQLAEECCELAQVCLKKARKIRNENYTPVSNDKIDADIIEEFSDVMLVTSTLKLKSDPVIMAKKATRWVKRNTKENESNEDNQG